MASNCIGNFKQIKDINQCISEDVYQHLYHFLNKPNIKEHIRHSLGHYICLFKGLEPNIVNYNKFCKYSSVLHLLKQQFLQTSLTLRNRKQCVQ